MSSMSIPRLPLIARLRGVLASPTAAEMGWAIANQLIVSGATFLIGIAAARLLGLEQFGRFAIVLILAGLMQGLHNSSVVVPMLTLAGQRARRSDNYFKAVTVWNGLLSIVAGLLVGLVVLVALALRDGEVSTTFVLATIAYTSTQNFHFTVRRLLFARHQARGALLLDVSRYTLLVAIIATAHAAGNDLSVEELLWALAGSAAISLLPFTSLLLLGRAARRMLGVVLQRHRQFAVWLLPMTLLTFASEQAIALGLGVVLNDEAVGGLRAGQYLLGITHFIVMAMENFVPGGASRALAAGGIPMLRSYLLRRLVLFGVPTGLLIAFLAAFAETCLRFAFGETFVVFAPILRVYALSYVCIFVRDVWTHYFRAVERTDQIFRAYVLSALAAGALFYPLVTLWGALGAALVILASHLASTAYMIFASSRHSATLGVARPLAGTPT